MIDADTSRESVEHLILDQRESLLADESFMNIYIAGRDWHFVPGFDAPPDFRVAEHPDEVYITEPYKDANTGDMCFTFSTLLSGRGNGRRHGFELLEGAGVDPGNDHRKG